MSGRAVFAALSAALLVAAGLAAITSGTGVSTTHLVVASLGAVGIYGGVGSLVAERVRRKRALDPSRLIAGVSRGAGREIAAIEPIEDALRVAPLLPSLLTSAAVVACLPTALGGYPGPDQFGIATGNPAAAGLVIARSASRLLVFKDDFPRTTRVLADVPTHHIASVEQGTVVFLRKPWTVFGVTLHNGSALAAMISGDNSDAVARFLAPLTPPLR